MIRKFIYLLFFIFCAYSTKAQSYFNNRYDVYGAIDIGASVINTDSIYFVLANAFDSSGSYRTLFFKIDYNGNVVHEQFYKRNGWNTGAGGPGSMQILNDGFAYAGSQFIFSGSNLASLIKVNFLGDTLWTKQFGDSVNFYTGYQCKQTTDGGFIIVGAMDNGSSTQALLIKTDSLGNFQWEQNFGGPGEEYGFSVCLMPDKGFLLTGQTTSYGNGSSNVYLVKTDSLGNLIWYKFYGTAYDEYATNIISTTDGNYVYSGFRGSSTQDYSWPTLTKVDSLGNLKWDKIYGPLRFGTVLYSLKEVENGNIVAVGSVEYQQGFTMDGLVIKADSSGNQIWYRRPKNLLGNNSVNILYDLDITNSGEIIACGSVGPSAPDTGSQDIWVIKLDEWGCDTLNCQYTGIEDLLLQNSGVSLFPNPNNGIFQLQFENDLPLNHVLLEVMDTYGRIIYSQWLSTNPSGVYLPDIPNGLYFYAITSETKRIHSGKIIIAR